MEAAMAWGLTPFEYWSRPEMEQCIMLTHYREKRLRKAHAQHAENKISERKSSSKDSGPTEHDRFFGGM